MSARIHLGNASKRELQREFLLLGPPDCAIGLRGLSRVRGGAQRPALSPVRHHCGQIDGEGEGERFPVGHCVSNVQGSSPRRYFLSSCLSCFATLSWQSIEVE